MAYSSSICMPTLSSASSLRSSCQQRHLHSCAMLVAARLRLSKSRNKSTLGLCHSLAGTSTLRFSLTLHAACENHTPMHICQAHAGYRSGHLVPLYICPVFYPTLSRRTTDSSGIPSSCKRDTSLLVLGSATGV